MSLEERILEVLNKPGQKGKLYTEAEILRKLVRVALEDVSETEKMAAIRVVYDDDLYLESYTENEKFNIVNGKDFAQVRGDDVLLVSLMRMGEDAYYASIEQKLFNIGEVRDTLKYLEEDGKIYSKNGEYRAFPHETGFVQGEVRINEKNEGYIEVGDGQFYVIPANDLNGILDGDTIVARPLTKKAHGFVVARVDKLIARKDGILDVRVEAKRGKKYVVPLSNRPFSKIVIDDYALDNLGIGSILRIRIDDLSEDHMYHAEFIQELDIKDIQDDIISAQMEEEMNGQQEEETLSKEDRAKALDLVLQYFMANDNRLFTLNQIQSKINPYCNLNETEMVSILSELEAQGLIYKNDKGNYRLFPKDLGYVQGNITITKFDEGIVNSELGRFKIENQDLHDALNGDLVVIRATGEVKNGYLMAKVEKVLERKDGLVVVEVTKNKDGSYYLRPFNARLGHKIIIDSNSMRPLVEGDRIVVKIGELTKNCYYADFVKNIGHKDDPDANLKVIAIENNIIIDFSEEALKEAEEIPTEVLESERAGRLDLTDKLIFTIDGARTKDRDDAVSIERLENGNYIVGVHISDVTHYVHPGMKMWSEALLRGTSVYMSDTVIPMLPHKLSNGICSLNEGVDRLTFSCMMEITPQGKVLSYDFVDSIINSRKAMTYDEVNQVLEEGEIVPGYEEFYDELEMLRQLSSKLEKVKERRGYVNFGSSDIEIEKDEQGNPLQFKPREQKTAEKIIENLMLLAGECYAEYMVIPSPLRVHERPDDEKVEEAFELLDKSGIRVRATHDLVNGHVIQQILKQIDDIDERTIAAQIILRAMNRARYDVNPVGHFGLGLPFYGHWTSPIRRAADLVGHYNLRMQRDNRFNIQNYDKFLEDMSSFCQHISNKERKADQAEIDANKFEMLRYMQQHLGEKFNGRVTFVTKKMIFVKTEDGIDGRIYPEDIVGDKFTFNDTTMSFVGKKSKIKLRIGTQLVLTSLEADRDFGSINFGVTSEDLPLIKAKRKGA